MTEENRLVDIIEALLFACNKPMTAKQLKSLIPEQRAVELEEINAALEQLQSKYLGQTIELKLLASGYRFLIREGFASWISKLWQEKPQRYSRAYLETIAIIAYRQPVTRGDIEDIRGVAVSSHIVKSLLEREWVRVVGTRDVPGKPSLYATTRTFLDDFGLENLSSLPPLSDLKDLTEHVSESMATSSDAQREDSEESAPIAALPCDENTPEANLAIVESSET